MLVDAGRSMASDTPCEIQADASSIQWNPQEASRCWQNLPAGHGWQAQPKCLHGGLLPPLPQASQAALELPSHWGKGWLWFSPALGCGVVLVLGLDGEWVVEGERERDRGLDKVHSC